MRTGWFSIVALVCFFGCSSGSGEEGIASDADVFSRADAIDASDGVDGTDSLDGTTGSEDGSEGADEGDAIDGSDADQPAGPPAPVAYRGGTCPTLQAGSNTFLSSDLQRQLTVTLPADPTGSGILFLWHGFGDTHSNFSASVGAQQISNAHNVITISAQAAVDAFTTDKLSSFASFKGMIEGQIGQIPPTWSILDGPELDSTLFDDLLSCVVEQYGANRSRVYSMGFSQGALWTSKLSLIRSEYIAASVAWSGGLGNTSVLLGILGIDALILMDYEAPARLIPMLTVSGTESDAWPNTQFLVVDFNTGTKTFSEQLRSDGVANVYCEHDEVLYYESNTSFPQLLKLDDVPDPLPDGARVTAHTIPSDGLGWGLQFLFDHEWTANGISKYRGYDGAGFPAYCTFP